jgi:hypothetical protein
MFPQLSDFAHDIVVDHWYHVLGTYTVYRSVIVTYTTQVPIKLLSEIM